MSKIKAAIITAIIGTSSAAMASPTVSFNANARFTFGTQHSAPIVRDHSGRGAMPQYAVESYQRPTTTWISLSRPLSLETGRDVLQPQMNLRNIAQIRLQANSGLSYIQRVNVRFRDGSRQSVDLNQWLSTRNPMLQFDLHNRRAIDTIVVIGTTSGRRASYQVFAQGATSVELPRPPVYNPQPTYTIHQSESSLNLSFADSGHLMINVRRGVPMAGVLFTGGAGRVHLDRMVVHYANGTTANVDLNRSIRPGQQFHLGLDSARGVSAIELFSDRDMGGQFILTAQ